MVKIKKKKKELSRKFEIECLHKEVELDRNLQWIFYKKKIKN